MPSHSAYLNEAARRASLIGKPASEVTTSQGAAINGVYHPPVEPWDGHPSDALDITPRQDMSPSLIFWRNFMIVAAVVVVLASLAGAVWP